MQFLKKICKDNLSAPIFLYFLPDFKTDITHLQLNIGQAQPNQHFTPSSHTLI